MNYCGIAYCDDSEIQKKIPEHASNRFVRATINVSTE